MSPIFEPHFGERSFGLDLGDQSRFDGVSTKDLVARFAITEVAIRNHYRRMQKSKFHVQGLNKGTYSKSGSTYSVKWNYTSCATDEKTETYTLEGDPADQISVRSSESNTSMMFLNDVAYSTIGFEKKDIKALIEHTTCEETAAVTTFMKAKNVVKIEPRKNQNRLPANSK
ncbi:MAG: hypothetical protein AB7H97_09565 [Pseudobdellovibrionaceae bacterium]